MRDFESRASASSATPASDSGGELFEYSNSSGLPEQPLHGVVLQLHVLRIPQHVQKMPGREITDPPFSIIVGPAGGGGCALLLESETVLVYALEKDIFRIFVVIHVVLLVGDGEVAHALGDRMIGFFTLTRKVRIGGCPV